MQMIIYLAGDQTGAACVQIKLSSCKTVQICYVYLHPVTFAPSTLISVPQFQGVWESREMRLKEL